MSLKNSFHPNKLHRTIIGKGKIVLVIVTALVPFSMAMALALATEKPRFRDPFTNTPAGRHRKLAHKYTLQNQNEKAIEQFTAAIALEPDEVWQYDARANLYTRIGRYDLALKDSERQILLQPSAHAYIIRGISFTGLGQHELAWKDFDTFLKLNPDIPWGWGCRFHLAGLGKHPKARILQECELLKKSVSAPWVNDMLAQVYMQNQCFDLARKYASSTTNPAIRLLILKQAGLEALKSDQVDKALRLFDEAISLDTKHTDIDLYEFRCQSLLKLKRFDDALRVADFVLSHSERRRPEIYILKAESLMHRDPETAMKVLDPAIAMNPKHRWLLEFYNTAARQLKDPALIFKSCELLRKNVSNQNWAQHLIRDSYLAAGRPDLATAYLDELIGRKPVAWVLIARGAIELQSLNTTKAFATFKQACQVDPGNPKPFWQSADLLMTYYRFDLAKELLDEAVQALPKNAAIRKTDAKCLLEMGLISRALDETNEAIALDPQDCESYYLRARALMGINDARAAVLDLNKCLALNGRFLDAYLYRGTIHADRGQFNSAIQDFSHYIRGEKNNYLAYSSRAHSYWKLGEKKLALTDLNTLLKLYPREAAYDVRANLYIELGDYDSALRDLSESLRLAPNSVSTLLVRGNLYERTGRLQLAIDDFSTALMLDNNCLEAYEERARVRSKLNQTALAEADLQQAERVREKYKTGIATFASSVASCLSAKLGAARRSFTK